MLTGLTPITYENQGIVDRMALEMRAQHFFVTIVRRWSLRRAVRSPPPPLSRPSTPSPPLLPHCIPTCLHDFLCFFYFAELEAANQRLIATDRDQRSKPTAAAAAAHAVKEAADAKKAAATLRRQVQHQADLIKRLRESNYDDDDGDGGDRHGAVAGAVATRISETVEASEEKARVAVEEAARLAQRLAETERELQRMERRAATAAAATTSAAAAEGYRDESGAAGPGQSGMGLSLSSASRSGGGGVARLEEENRRLAEENDKLSRELQAFDLDFFEEIEDLKYKYSEAARKLRQYE